MDLVNTLICNYTAHLKMEVYNIVFTAKEWGFLYEDFDKFWIDVEKNSILLILY